MHTGLDKTMTWGERLGLAASERPDELLFGTGNPDKSSSVPRLSASLPQASNGLFAVERLVAFPWNTQISATSVGGMSGAIMGN